MKTPRRSSLSAKLDLAWASYSAQPTLQAGQDTLMEAILHSAKVTARTFRIKDEDAIQTAALALWEVKDKYDVTRAKFSTWANSILKQQCRSWLSKQALANNREVSLEKLRASTFKELVVDSGLGVEAQERQAGIDKALARLSPEKRVVIQQRLEGFSFGEIAKFARITVSAAKERWRLGLKELDEA